MEAEFLSLKSFSETYLDKFLRNYIVGGMDTTHTNTRTPNLPQQVAAVLRQELGHRFKAGDKLPGMHLLRQRFGVSINTIGAALDILAGDGLLERRRGSGVYVAERAFSRRLGILSELDLFDHRISPHFRAVAGSLNQRLRETGATVKIYAGHAEPGPGKSDTPTCPQFWEDVAAGRLDGAVILDTPATDAWYFRLQACPIPLVGPLTNYDAELDVPGMMQAAVMQLAVQGCRRLGMLSAQPSRDFASAVATAGLETHPSWMGCGLETALRGGGWEQFRDIWSSRAGRPEGLVILDDMLFADAQLAIYELGVRVPAQLRLAVLVNRDASPIIRLPVTTLELDPGERAAMLTDMLLARLQGNLSTPTKKLLPFRVGNFTPQAAVAATVSV